MAPVWIWIHGWGMSTGVWGDPGNWMPEAQHRLFTYAGCDTIGEMKRRLTEMIRREARPVRLIGWSMGGMLALEAALDEWDAAADKPPAQEETGIAGAVLIGATLRFVGHDRSRAWPERIVRRMRAQLAAQPEETLRRFAEAMLSEPKRPAASKTGTREAGERFPHHSFGALPAGAAGGWSTDFTLAGLDSGLAYLLETDLTGRWRRFLSSGGYDRYAGRIVWLHGENDPICPIGALDEVPASDKLVWDGAGHAPMLTQPASFRSRMRSLLDDHR